ncbi:MAG: AI-2E family transporter [Deltaproteobacteria bacterium]|nr:AI-2E family transporter [Deltaproteobacteria bacterium]MBW1719731.1 AI-2E family transporter [Deltaproteobacteria bacterium]
MQIDDSTVRKLLSRDFMNAVVRIGLIAFLVVMCVRVFAPFANLVLWALILAIALYPLHQRLARWFGGRQGRAATLLVVACLLLIGGPTVMLGGSFARHVHDAYTDFENNTVSIKQPNPAVADWPLVGKRVYSAWSLAADNLPAFLKDNRAQLKNISKRAFSAAANTAGSVLLFLGALIIAGIMMAYGESGSQVIKRIFYRLTDSVTGPRLQSLSTATVRSVAIGVIGVAFIQALLLGLGFIMAGIPAAGVLALVVMLLGIVQLPAAIISLPAIAYLWWSGDASTTIKIVYTIYLLVAGLADNVLKPLLLGRGVEAPMPVILLGALGGMVSGGIIGMFVGAVLLAVGYQVFMDWVDNVEEGTSAKPGQIETVDQVLPAIE